MRLEDSEVLKIARLARLQLGEQEVAAFSQQLSSILDFVAEMDLVATTGVVPLAHPLDVKARLRPDKVTEVDRRDDFQQIAPLVEDGLYLVPKVIE